MSSRNAAVAMLLSDLRDELLVAPREDVAEAHVAMMRFEQQVRTTAGPTNAAPSLRRAPRVTVQARVRRAATTNPRRFAALVAALSVLLGSLGLNAAGALPDAFHHLSDHITNTIVHTFDTPQPPQTGTSGQDRSEGVTTSSAPGSIGAREIALGARGAGSTASSTTPTSGVDGSGPSHTPTTSGSSPTSSPSPPGTTPGSLPPPRRTMQKDPGTPPGFASNWRDLALGSARGQLQACSQANVLAPAGCPQDPEGLGVIATPSAVHWSVLNEPLAGASAIARYATSRANASSPTGTQVTVYGLFQMEASYTESGDAHQYFAYSGGVARATMTWNGSGFEDVHFDSGSATGQLPQGVYVPMFERPAGVTDGALRDAVLAGFQACATPTTSPYATLPGCPQIAGVDAGATNMEWSLLNDPSAGAAVTFDGVHGDFTVSGDYEMSLSYILPSADAGPPTGGSVVVNGTYTATLVANGSGLQLITISRS